jgi:hypothetical protein
MSRLAESRLNGQVGLGEGTDMPPTLVTSGRRHRRRGGVHRGELVAFALTVSAALLVFVLLPMVCLAVHALS